MNESNIIFYRTKDGTVKIEIRFNEETFWLTQKKLAELFGVEVQTINYHLKEIFKSWLQSRRHYCRRVSGKISYCHQVPNLGGPTTERYLAIKK